MLNWIVFKKLIIRIKMDLALNNLKKKKTNKKKQKKKNVDMP